MLVLLTHAFITERAAQNTATRPALLFPAVAKTFVYKMATQIAKSEA